MWWWRCASPLGASCAVRRNDDPQPSLFLREPSSVPTLPWIQSHTSEVRDATRRASTKTELGENRGLPVAAKLRLLVAKMRLLVAKLRLLVAKSCLLVVKSYLLVV